METEVNKQIAGVRKWLERQQKKIENAIAALDLLIEELPFTGTAEEAEPEEKANVTLEAGVARVMRISAGLEMSKADVIMNLKRIGLYNVKPQSVLASLSRGVIERRWRRISKGIYMQDLEAE